MQRFLISFLVLCALANPAAAAVELTVGNKPPATIAEVYYREGMSFLAIDDVLPVLGLQGRWDSINHQYQMQTPFGDATLSPGSEYLRIGERFIPLRKRPRFIDGRLRVDENLVSEQLPALLGVSVYYRNLNPQTSTAAEEEPADSLDRLFAFLLNKKEAASGPLLRGVVIDPGHGGQDPGAIGLGGVKEKDVTLELARGLEKQLKMQLGIPVFLTRDSDYALTAQQRVEPAAHPEVDVLLQLHAQASPGADTAGMVLFVREQEEVSGKAVPAEQGDSLKLATALRETLVKQGFVVREIVRAPLLPLGRGNLPTVLIEMGYLSHAGDLALLTEAESQQRLAKALFDGLQTFADQQKENPL